MRVNNSLKIKLINFVKEENIIVLDYTTLRGTETFPSKAESRKKTENCLGK